MSIVFLVSMVCIQFLVVHCHGLLMQPSTSSSFALSSSLLHRRRIICFDNRRRTVIHSLRGGFFDQNIKKSPINSNDDTSMHLKAADVDPCSNNDSKDSNNGANDSIGHDGKLGLYHGLSARESLQLMQSDLSKGLTSDIITQRVTQFGLNEIPRALTKTLWMLVREQFQDKLVQMLFGVAILSTIFAYFEGNKHALTEPIVIASILCINAIVGIYHSKSSDNSLEALAKLQSETSCVLRDGNWISDLPSKYLVPGDIVELKTGIKVPADMRIVQMKSTYCSADESSLTGESEPVDKNDDVLPINTTHISSKKNMLFSGTLLMSGACIGLVVATGASTELGQINRGVQLASASAHKTPLAEQLDTFSGDLGKLVMAVCALVWAVNIPNFKARHFPSWVHGAVHFTKAAVALGVAAIPEGLPAVITMSLALGTTRLAKRNALIKTLPAVETLGCTSVICTDKTGTLTTNQMVVRTLLTFARDEISNSKTRSGARLVERSIEGNNYNPKGNIIGEAIVDVNNSLSSSLADIATIASVCSDSKLIFVNETIQSIGAPTEVALKVLAEKLLSKASEKYNGTSDWKSSTSASPFADDLESKFRRLSVLEFDRDRKSMSVLCRTWERENISNNLLVKGAAEMVLSRCNRLKLEDGSIVPIDTFTRAKIASRLEYLSKVPQRCIALAYTDDPRTLGPLHSAVDSDAAVAATKGLIAKHPIAAIESDMVLVGITGIYDPARPEAGEAITKCREAGIRVMMITGDSKDTAVSIAKNVNILRESDDIETSAFSGEEFFKLPHERQLSLLRSGNKVFARTQPSDKQKLIAMLSALGETTAMTGDGVNDAPALKEADIGIAMGITGSDVAKGAADMVLADDNFATIVAAVEEGRSIYSNMMAFVNFLISSNIGEVCMILFASLMGLPELVSPLHLLLINLVTDGPPATALGFNPADPLSMTVPPRSRNVPILTRNSLIKYFITGLYVSMATIGSFAWLFRTRGISFSNLRDWGNIPQGPTLNAYNEALPVAQSIALSVVVAAELLKAISAISDRSLITRLGWKNPWVLLAVAFSMLLHLFVLYVPQLANIFRLQPLTWTHWKVVLLAAAPIVLIEEIIKYFKRVGQIANWRTFQL